MNDFVSELTSWMKNRGYSQKDLAEKFSVSQATVCLWLKGKRTPGRKHIQAFREIGIDLVKSYV